MRITLVALLALAALAPSCRKPETGVRVDPALATLVPSDTVMMAGVKVEAVRQTPAYARYIEKNSLLRIDELAKTTGFDPRQDLYELLFVSNGKDGVVMARGKFSPLGLEPKPGGSGVERMSYKGMTIFGDQASGVLFMNASVAIAGPTRLLHGIVDQRDQRSGIPKPLGEQLAKVRSGSQVWAVSLGGDKLAALLPESGNASNLARILSDVQYSTLSLNLSSGLDLDGRALYSNDKSAKQTCDAVRALLGFARLSTPDSEPDLLKAFDNIQVNQEGPMLKVGAQLTPELLDKLAAVAARRLPR